MNERAIAGGIAVSRMAVGAAFLLAPALAARPWLGADSRRAGTRLLARGLGARDVAIGAGTLLALETGSPRQWVAAGALADGADFAATLLAGDRLPPAGRALVLVMAGSATAAGLWLTHSMG